MSTVNRCYHQSNTLLFYIELFNTITVPLCLLIYMFLFLSIFYVYHNCSGRSSLPSFRENYKGFVFLTTIYVIRDILNNPVRMSMPGDCLKQQIEEPVGKFFMLSHIDVLYTNYDDFKRDKDRYQIKYKNIHFHYVKLNSKKSPKKKKTDSINTRLSTDQTTTSNSISTIKECVPYEGFKSFDQNHSDKFISCSLCTEQVERSKIYEHYLSKTHQQILSNILLRLHSIKIKNDQMAFSQIDNTISILSNDVTMIDNNIQQTGHEYHFHENSLQVVTQDLLSLEILTEENDNCLHRMSFIQDIFRQDIDLVKQRLENREVISFDGTLMWKISDIQQKFNDAKFERQRSIYSPEFYSSLFGYKMRSRLFLNGVNNARGTHWSIYFILMRSDYDALLEWPFCFKVTFSLLDQSIFKNNQIHLSKFFWSDIKSICFRRPRSEMNEAYGIENFLSLDQFQQNQERYVQNDTIFIKVEVDFQSTSPESFSDSADMLINDERHTDTNDDDLMRKFLFMMENSNRVQ